MRPDAVATAPVTTSAAQAGTPSHVTTRRSRLGLAGAASPETRLQAFEDDDRGEPEAGEPEQEVRHDGEGAGRRTVIPPIGIWATATRNAASAAPRPIRESPSTCARPARSRA